MAMSFGDTSKVEFRLCRLARSKHSLYFEFDSSRDGQFRLGNFLREGLTHDSFDKCVEFQNAYIFLKRVASIQPPMWIEHREFKLVLSELVEAKHLTVPQKEKILKRVILATSFEEKEENVQSAKDWKAALTLADEYRDTSDLFSQERYLHWLNEACHYGYDNASDLATRLAKITSLWDAKIFRNPHSLMLEALILNKSIRSLSFGVLFHRSALTDSAVKFLQETKSLQKLNLSTSFTHHLDWQLNDEDAEKLASVLEINQSLTQLEIGDQNLSQHGVKKLIDALMKNKKNVLSSLNLFGTCGHYTSVGIALDTYKKMPHCKLNHVNRGLNYFKEHVDV